MSHFDHKNMTSQPATVDELKKDLLNDLRSNPEDMVPLIEKLRSHTVLRGLIKPDDEPAQFATWLAMFSELWNANRIFQATEIAFAWYQRICDLQEVDRRRYHKGGVTHLLGNSYFNRQLFSHAVWFYTAAFVEDAISEQSPELNPTPGTRTLRVRFNWSDRHFREIAKMVKQALMEQPHLCGYPETVIVNLARSQKLFLPLAHANECIPINRAFLKRLIAELEGKSADEKKKSLEFLASYLAVTLPSVKIVPNARTLDYEMDLIVIQQASTPTYLLEALGRSFIVECKNLQKTVGVEQLNHFVAKMRFNRCQCGVIFSPEGISSDNQPGQSLRNARLTQLRWYQQDERIIIVVALSHLKEMVEGPLSFADLLLRGYESVRFSVSENTAT